MGMREKLKLREFGLEYREPRHFVSLQCGRPVLYLVWTTLWTIYHLIWVAYDAYFYNSTWDVHPASWLVYLTNWSYLLLTLHSFLDFIITCYIYFSKSGKTAKLMPWYKKLNWLIFNIINTSAILLTLTYWILLAQSTVATSINKHGLNAIYVILCVCFTAKPIKLQHFYIPALYNLVYIIFCSIYQVITGHVVYSFLNWGESPLWAAILSLGYVLVCCPIMHCLLFGLYRLRLVVAKRCCHDDQQSPLNDVEVGMLPVNGTKEETMDPSDQRLISNGHHKSIWTKS